MCMTEYDCVYTLRVISSMHHNLLAAVTAPRHVMHDAPCQKIPYPDFVAALCWVHAAAMAILNLQLQVCVVMGRHVCCAESDSSGLCSPARVS